MITEDRMADVSRPASQEAVANTDFNPVLYYYHLLQWISRFKESFGLLGGALLVVLAAYLVRIRRVELAVFTAGFAASVLEVVLLLGFQVLYGSVYNRLGLIVTMFMAGLGAGSVAAKVTLARRGRRDLAAVVLALAVYAAALPLLLQGAGRLEEAVSSVAAGSAVFSILAFVPGALVGMAFPLAGKVDFQGASLTAGRLYAADLVGASLGAILVSTLLIPLIGVTAVCLVTAGLNVVGGLALLMKRGS
jgi:spermidine synthase